MTRKERVEGIIPILRREYPEAGCLLDYGNDPFRLLIATILSAQTTDAGVNRVTPELWSRYPDVDSLANADQSELESLIHPLGFFRNKARSIKSAAAYLIEHFGGEVPDTMKQLVQIPGTGRKTANVVLGEIFGKPAIIVDTHVKRLAGRIGLSRRTQPDRIETDLARVVPAACRTDLSHQLGFHGRRVCHSRKPRCQGCSILAYCARKGVAS